MSRTMTLLPPPPLGPIPAIFSIPASSMPPALFDIEAEDLFVPRFDTDIDELPAWHEDMPTWPPPA